MLTTKSSSGDKATSQKKSQDKQTPKHTTANDNQFNNDWHQLATHVDSGATNVQRNTDSSLVDSQTTSSHSPQTFSRLTLGAANDPLEHEADRVGDIVAEAPISHKDSPSDHDDSGQDEPDKQTMELADLDLSPDHKIDTDVADHDADSSALTTLSSDTSLPNLSDTTSRSPIAEGFFKGTEGSFEGAEGSFEASEEFSLNETTAEKSVTPPSPPEGPPSDDSQMGSEKIDLSLTDINMGHQDDLGGDFLPNGLISADQLALGDIASYSMQPVQRQVQTKLAIGGLDDASEREADQMSDRISAAPRSVQRIPHGPAGDEDASLESRITSPSGGRPLSGQISQHMETQFGADFSSVRIHEGGQAQADSAQLGAKAFTYGNHIWLGADASENDFRLMGHELTHVLQQGGAVRRSPEGDTSDTGFFSGIGSSIRGLVSGLRSGWGGLSRMASGAMSTISGQASSIVTGLSETAASAWQGIRQGWSLISDAASQRMANLSTQVSSAFSGIAGFAGAFGRAVMNLDASALRSLWSGLTRMVGHIRESLMASGRALMQSVVSAWQGLGARLNGLMKRLSTMAQAAFSRLQSMARGLFNRLRSLWDGLRNRAAQMSGLLGRAVRGVQAVLGRLASWGRGVWQGIQRSWRSLRTGISRFARGIAQRARSTMQRIRRGATGLWTRLRRFWQSLKSQVSGFISRVGRRISSIWDEIVNFDIWSVIQSIEAFAPLIRAVQQGADNPDSMMRPIAQSLSDQISAAMPDKAAQFAAEKIAGEGGSTGASTATDSATHTPVTNTPASNTTAASPSAIPAGTSQSGGSSPNPTLAQASLPASDSAPRVQRTPSDKIVQRVPMKQPLSQGVIWSGYWQVLKDGWNTFWKAPVDNILRILYEMIAVWHTIPNDLIGLWNDMGTVFTRMFASGMGFWRHLLDVPLILWRRVNNILMHLYPWFVLISVGVGALAGAGFLGTAGTAILGFFSGGLAAAPGGAAGAGIGAVGGAGLGLGFALGVGEGLLASYLAAEVLSFLKAWGDLSLVKQTEKEQAEDLSQMVSSSVGAGIALVLWAIAAIGARLAKGLIGNLKPGGAAETFIKNLAIGFRRGSPFRSNSVLRPAEPEPPASSGRQTEHVPGLYEAIDPANPPSGYNFSDTVTTSPSGRINVRTQVTAPDGTTGSMNRSFDPSMGEVSFESAFLDRIPKPLRMVSTQPEMLPGRGTPLETYMTMRQLRLIEQEMANAASSSGASSGTSTNTGAPSNTGSGSSNGFFASQPRQVHMSTIINQRTVAELAAAEIRNPGVDINQAILNTHSVQYANNTITQGGGRITGARVQHGMRIEASFELSAELMQRHNIPGDYKVLSGFDIDLSVVPADSPLPPPASGPVSAPAPAPLLSGSDDDNKDE